jgi:predicted nucleic acid-binding protein
MEVNLDTNILFRALISTGVVVLLLFDVKLKVNAPERMREEFYAHKEEIMKKSQLSEEDFNVAVALLFEKVNFIHLENYQQFLPEAKKLLGEHTKDAEFIALCLMNGAKLWTYEKLLFDIGFGISTREIARGLYGNSE